VANLTRGDGDECLKLAAKIPLKTVVSPFPLSNADEALELVRSGKVEGAAVLRPGLEDGE
jgi:propanol-preferring alcohol dehydrogenase